MKRVLKEYIARLLGENSMIDQIDYDPPFNRFVNHVCDMLGLDPKRFVESIIDEETGRVYEHFNWTEILTESGDDFSIRAWADIVSNFRRELTIFLDRKLIEGEDLNEYDVWFRRFQDFTNELTLLQSYTQLVDDLKYAIEKCDGDSISSALRDVVDSNLADKMMLDILQDALTTSASPK